ncbi:MAG: 23S rRNA (uracil(1939)-C(5))-methyltransferase RlmD [Gammaproteobacteria bacterium]|nr:23S rRNA (uracil(1939)-C(5))-methyltransferase RlmD [Gammaproteobacteria bacterium]
MLQARVGGLAADGGARVEADGRVYSVDGVVPGEWVEFQARKKRRGQLRGVLTRVIEASPERVAPRCAYFGVCGGCTRQHITPAAQLAFKEKALFKGLAGIPQNPPPHRIKPVPTAVWQYRRKARLGVRYVPKKGGILIGFRERGSGYITSLARCPVLDAGLSALLPALHECLDAISCRDKIPQIEATAADNAVALVLRHLQPLNAADLALLKRFAVEREVQFFLQPGGLDTLAPLWPAAPEPLFYRLDDHDLTLRFGPTDFVQVNARANDLMVNLAMDLLRPGAGDRILDLFCGVGNFTLPMARNAAAVLGIEGAPGLVRRAAENAALNGLENAEFKRMDLDRPDCTPLPGQLLKFNKMLLDPPRSGAAEALRRLIPEAAPRVIVYVSCNPVTLVRDAAILTRDHGYTLTHAGVIDMFAHTARMESITRFER